VIGKSLVDPPMVEGKARERFKVTFVVAEIIDGAGSEVNAYSLATW
jgi:hypothetical protein